MKKAAKNVEQERCYTFFIEPSDERVNRTVAGLRPSEEISEFMCDDGRKHQLWAFGKGAHEHFYAFVRARAGEVGFQLWTQLGTNGKIRRLPFGVAKRIAVEKMAAA